MIRVQRSLWMLIFWISLAGAGLTHEVGLRATIEARGVGGETLTYSEANLPRNAQVTSVQIIAYYNTGEPMANAQVRVFAPGDSEVPWRTGTSDRQGHYTFTPDLSRRGRWTVRVRSSGHSSFINLVF